MSVEDFIITVYCLVEDFSKKVLKGQKLRKRGFLPGLSDEEVITMEIVAEFLKIDTDKGAWEYFSRHFKSWFPLLGSRANYAKQASNLWRIKQLIQEELGKKLNAKNDIMHMCDGFPMPTCEFKRAHGSKLFKEEASYGYCASKAKTYYGFKGNIVINSQGVISTITVTAANIDERESLWDILSGIKGMMIADKGLIGSKYQQTLKKFAQIDMQTVARDNMDESRPKKYLKWLASTRRLVETVIGQLTDRFNIEKIRARKLWYLTNRIARKVLAHTMAAFINTMLGNPTLAFDLIIKS